MKIKFRAIRSISIIFICCICFPSNAHAYLDLGSGSYIIQILLASLLGVLFCLKSFWIKIASHIKKLLSKKAADESNQ